MSLVHFYVPAPDQPDAQARADALGATLVSIDLASEARYVDRISSLPCVICDHGDAIIVLPEPVTPEQLEAAHDLLLEENVPTTVARTADQVIATAEAIATHTAAANNPHGITPAMIGAATPADIDTRISQVVGTAPAALDTLNELASALGNDANYASTVTSALAGKAPTGHNHDAAYAPTHAHPYAATSHAHVDADLPAGLARDAEVAAGYSPLGHTHGAAAPAAHAASHATAAADAISPAAIGAATSGHTHSYEASGAVATHAAASDPHPTYLTQAEGDGRYRQSATSLVDADIPAAIARDTEVTSAISTHAAAADPHTGYATDTDLSNHAAAADPHPTYLTSAEHTATDHTGITGVGGGGAGATGGVIRKTAAQTMTATAQTAITDASFAVAASAKYYFIMYVAVTTSTGTSPTTAYGLTGPTGATVAVTMEQDTSTSVEASGVITAFGNFAAGAQVANTGAELRGVVETGATAGTVQLTVARAGTNPSMVIPIGGVVGFWMRLA